MENADFNPLLIAQKGDVNRARNMVFLVFEGGADIDDTVGVEMCFTEYRDSGQGVSPESCGVREGSESKKRRVANSSGKLPDDETC